MSSRLTRRTIVAGGLLVGIGCASRAARAQMTSHGPATQGAVSPQSIDQRLEKRAAELKQMAPQGADRYVLFDLAFPADPAEYRAVGGSALILITAVSKRADELPLRRVYTRAAGKDVDCRKLGSRRSELPAGSLARAVVGRYREDAFWFAPIGALLSESLLMCDFARNRTGFIVNRAALDPPDFIRVDRPADAAAKPEDAAVRAFVEREFPGFGILAR
jgi:hypothetical protein